MRLRSVHIMNANFTESSFDNSTQIKGSLIIWLTAISFYENIVFYALGIFANLYVLCATFKKIRTPLVTKLTARILVCHLSLLTILQIFVKCLNTDQILVLIQLQRNTCSFVSYFESKSIKSYQRLVTHKSFVHDKSITFKLFSL